MGGGDVGSRAHYDVSMGSKIAAGINPGGFGGRGADQAADGVAEEKVGCLGRR